jgi:hypothetical protein
MSSLVEELQRESLSQSVSVDELLRKAKVVAEKLGVYEIRDWIDRELHGYAQNDEFPEYRKISSEFQAFNPYHGWQPIIVREPERAKWLFEPRVVTTSAGQIEAGSDRDDQFLFILDAKVKAQLIQSLEFPTDVRCLLNRSEVLDIPRQVRNKILGWSLDLWKAGITGEGLSFSALEKAEARTVSINVHGDVGNLSSVTDVAPDAIVITHQNNSEIDLKLLAELAAQLKQHSDALVRRDERARLADEINEIETEIKAGKPDRGKMRRALTIVQGMIRDATVTTGKSLLVQGAMSMIADALKSL